MPRCKIFLSNYNGIYFAGSHIEGRVECFFEEAVTIRNINIRLICNEHNRWTFTNKYNCCNERSVSFMGDNDVMYVDQMLESSGSGKFVLEKGYHVYPFCYILPYEIPDTFDGPYGSITYKLKAIIDRPVENKEWDQVTFEVAASIDFTWMLQDLQKSARYSKEKTFSSYCWCDGGSVTLDVELPKLAFVPGEIVPFKMHVCNESRFKIKNVVVVFEKTITYIATYPNLNSKYDKEVISTLKEQGLGPNQDCIYYLKLAIPHHLSVPNFTNCRLFTSAYKLLVTCKMEGSAKHLTLSILDILMGHVQGQAEGRRLQQAGGFVSRAGGDPPHPIGRPSSGSSTTRRYYRPPIELKTSPKISPR